MAQAPTDPTNRARADIFATGRLSSPAHPVASARMSRSASRARVRGSRCWRGARACSMTSRAASRQGRSRSRDRMRCDQARRGRHRPHPVTRSFKRLDILVNSAGVMIPGQVEKLKLADLEKMMSVNVYGALNAMQAAIPVVRRQGAGNIINIASLAGRRGMSPLGGYSATKFAMVGLTEALRMELFGSGIRVSLVMPGVIDTPMTSDAVSRIWKWASCPRSSRCRSGG